MKLIAGLGNPGKEYEKTRHNSGFLAMDFLTEKLGIVLHSKKFDALVEKTVIQGVPVLLMKPQTYMNDSGKAVSEAVSYYHIDSHDILIIHDDMDLPVGTVRIRKNGSAGGQKGMNSIIQALHTADIARIRIGVGHSEPGNHEVVPDWVLSPISKADRPAYENALKDAAEAAEAWVNHDMDLVMNQYNIKVHSDKKE